MPEQEPEHHYLALAVRQLPDGSVNGRQSATICPIFVAICRVSRCDIVQRERCCCGSPPRFPADADGEARHPGPPRDVVSPSPTVLPRTHQGFLRRFAREPPVAQKRAAQPINPRRQSGKIRLFRIISAYHGLASHPMVDAAEVVEVHPSPGKYRGPRLQQGYGTPLPLTGRPREPRIQALQLMALPGGSRYSRGS